MKTTITAGELTANAFIEQLQQLRSDEEQRKIRSAIEKLDKAQWSEKINKRKPEFVGIDPFECRFRTR